MPLNVDQFLEAVRQDDAALAASKITVSCCCEESAMCSDCYFDALSDELDHYPLGAVRAIRGT